MSAVRTRRLKTTTATWTSPTSRSSCLLTVVYLMLFILKKTKEKKMM